MASSSDIFNSKVDNSTVPVSVQQTPTGQPNLVSKEPVPSSAICDPGEEPGSTSSSFQGIDSNSPNTESSSVTLKAMGLEIRALFEAVFKHIHTSQKVTKVPEVARPDCKDIIDSFVQMTTNNEDLYRMLLKKLHQHYEALGFLIDEYFFADQLKFLIEFQSDRFEWWAAKNGLYRGNLDACLKGNAESMAAGEERWKPEYGPGLRTQMSNLRKTLNKIPTFFADEKNYNVRQLESIYERFTDEEVKNINDCIFSLHRLTSDSAFQMLVEKVDDDLKNESDDQHICAGPSTVEH